MFTRTCALSCTVPPKQTRTDSLYQWLRLSLTLSNTHTLSNALACALAPRTHTNTNTYTRAHDGESGGAHLSAGDLHDAYTYPAKRTTPLPGRSRRPGTHAATLLLSRRSAGLRLVIGVCAEERMPNEAPAATDDNHVPVTPGPIYYIAKRIHIERRYIPKEAGRGLKRKRGRRRTVERNNGGGARPCGGEQIGNNEKPKSFGFRDKARQTHGAP